MLRSLTLRLSLAVWALTSIHAFAQGLPLKQRVVQDAFSQVSKFIAVMSEFPRDKINHIYYQINTCLYKDERGSNREEQFMIDLEAMAGNYLNLAEDLGKARYPELVWRAPLNDLLNAQVANLLKRYQTGQNLEEITAIRKPNLVYEKQFLQVLNQYRVQHNPSLGEYYIAEEFGCGGDFIGYVKLTTNPRGGSIRVISDFFFRLCKVSGVEPYSDQCDMWISVGPTTEIPQGTYHYLASWANGPRECDRIELTQGKQPSDRPVLNTINATGRTCSN